MGSIPFDACEEPDWDDEGQVTETGGRGTDVPTRDGILGFMVWGFMVWVWFGLIGLSESEVCWYVTSDCLVGWRVCPIEANRQDAS